MFIGYAAVFQINYEINLDDILIKVVSAAFFEELFFRGFLFGQVFKTTKIGFIPAVLIGSLLFGFLHLYQSDDILESLGIFIITFFGGILFAWVFVEWNYNLWMAIFLHFFMNLSALLFSATENALGGIYFNVFRSLSLILVISITIFYKKNKRLNFQINKNTIWVKK
jgi:membrane protease YdiL (CAAX protease family)